MKDNTNTATARPCFAHRHMTGNEYAIYDLGRSKAQRTGILILSSRKMANEFVGMSKTTANDTAQSLVSKGWFDPITIRPDGKLPPGIKARYRVLTHAQWVAKFPDKESIECRSNEEPVSAHKDTSVRPEGHSGLDEVSAIQGVLSEITRVVSEIPREVSEIRGEVSAAKHVSAAIDRGLEALTSTNLYKTTSTNTSVNLCPPGSDFANASLCIGQESAASADTGSAPASVPPAGHPVYPLNAGMVLRVDSWVNAKDCGRLSDSQIDYRLSTVDLRLKEGVYYSISSGQPVEWDEAIYRITGERPAPRKMKE